ncbi:hypothetical protein HY029_02135 [Candidatus Gottesmanbacteria bacterium]|nr:hypothetical protein [Candidatus Gottesmanbacteria bacterium]
MIKRVIKVGLDFDGVVAYNPFRIIRPVVAFVKRKIFGVNKLEFWYPKARWQQIYWAILHESSIFPSKGVDLLKDLVDKGYIEAHLVTARYSFLDNHLYRWIDRYKLRKYFKTINLNKNDEQPHIFKERMIEKHKFDYFIEDNWDIVKYLHTRQETAGKKHTKIYWIYNILDHFVAYQHKFPYLKKAIEAIINQE